MEEFSRKVAKNMSSHFIIAEIETLLEEGGFWVKESTVTRSDDEKGSELFTFKVERRKLDFDTSEEVTSIIFPRVMELLLPEIIKTIKDMEGSCPRTDEKEDSCPRPGCSACSAGPD